ncbi:hypothetical protein [Pelagerythrobacter aerophilus]|uniref:Uncharacterized protein n=1 Tax=Pelagerythrobacter aerophilus TaxID=2306995 RepID=A0A418NGY8_9SPHN|nr:hypothetical protein [Pelagerythrobacter aerophilus]RIV77594.1 hypothetical protein D2V04_10755 [Pelagerythrobacter aerophilus]
MIEWFKIIGFSVIAAIIYGILHDLITAHVALEYFTIAHPPVFPTRNPMLLAFGWGVIATWWSVWGLASRLQAAPDWAAGPVSGCMRCARAFCG